MMVMGSILLKGLYMLCILTPGDWKFSSARSQVRNHSAEGKRLAQGHPDGKALGVSVLILGSSGPGWRLRCDSYPPGGSKVKPSPFSLLGSSRPRQVFLGPSCPFGATSWFPPLWWRRSPCCSPTRGPGLGNWAWGPDHPRSSPRAGRAGFAEGKAGLHPLLCLPFELLL